MISRQKAFVTSDGKLCNTLEDAQKCELATLFASAGMGLDDAPQTECAIENAVAAVITHKDKFLSILATRKPRTPKAKTVRIKKTATIATTEGK